MNKKSRKFSQSYSEFIVNNKWIFVGIFVVLIIAACVLIPRIKVVYDLSSSLPKQADSSKALALLKKEFDDKGMAYIAVCDITEEELPALTEKLSTVEGVAAATLTKSVGNDRLYTINLQNYDSTPEAFAATERLIEAVSGEEAYFTGQSAYSYFTKQETVESIMIIALVIAVAILLMLVFTSKTYFEIVLMLLVFGVAVALNIGSNFLFFNGISYISNLVGIVLQLALSLDYSVILLHRYMEEKDLKLPSKQAAATALRKATPEIFSSSLTTIGGLCSLMFMALPIGVEIGIALAKGIVCSLLSVIFLMPALLVIFDRPLEKSRHKSFIPNITKPAGAIVKARKIIVPIFIAIVICSCVGQFYNTYAFNMNGGSKIVTAQKAIEEKGFGTLNSLVIAVPGGDPAKERELAAYLCGFEEINEVTALSTIKVPDENGVYLTDRFTQDEFVETFAAMAPGMGVAIRVLGPALFKSYVKQSNITDEVPRPRLVDILVYVCEAPEYADLLGDYGAQLKQLVFAKQNLESENYTRLTFNICSGIESEKTFELIRTVKANLGGFYEDFYITGESVVCYDMAQYFPKDNIIVSVFTVVFVLIVLLLTFRNFAIPIILLLGIEGGIWINFVIPLLAGNSVSFIGYLIICAVQMGATIDYAIVLTNRYQTTKKQFADRYKAMAAAENAVFPTVITSGVILIITGFTLGMASSGVVSQLGTLLGVGALASVLIVLLVLPSLLLVTEKLLDKANWSDIFTRHRKPEDCIEPPDEVLDETPFETAASRETSEIRDNA